VQKTEKTPLLHRGSCSTEATSHLTLLGHIPPVPFQLALFQTRALRTPGPPRNGCLCWLNAQSYAMLCSCSAMEGCGGITSSQRWFRAGFVREIRLLSRWTRWVCSCYYGAPRRSPCCLLAWQAAVGAIGVVLAPMVLTGTRHTAIPYSCCKWQASTSMGNANVSAALGLP
jgi:hypothetical protein